jgi:hypothetical protein
MKETLPERLLFNGVTVNILFAEGIVVGSDKALNVDF